MVIKCRFAGFVGFGAGSDKPMFAPQQKIVDDCSSFHDDIELVLEIVDAEPGLRPWQRK